MSDHEPEPWSLPRPKFSVRALGRIGAGALVASFFIGTADITIATKMGAIFGFDMWWTYFVLGLAGWSMMDMSVRYYLRFGRTPLSLFKELHPWLAGYVLVTVVVTTTVGAYSQWNACARVLAGMHPDVPAELGGAVSAALAFGVIATGAYRRIETMFVFGLIALVGLFGLSAVATRVDWSEAAAGLVPSGPDEREGVWADLLQANAGSLINAWLILVYPYTMIEKRWFARDTRGKAELLARSRWDYGVGILAAGVVALPIMAAAHAVAGPFGIVPNNGTEFAVLLEPFAGPAAERLFLTGLFLAAWTAGIGWIVCGAYAVLDMGNLEMRLASGNFRVVLAIFAASSAAILFLRVNPFEGIQVFAAFLAVVFPVVALALVWRVSRRDMGYFRWSLKTFRGVRVVVLDLFAVAVSSYVGWGMIRRFFGD